MTKILIEDAQPVEFGLNGFGQVQFHGTAVCRVGTALNETGGNVTHAARLLGLTRKGLQNIMRRYKIEVKR